MARHVPDDFSFLPTVDSTDEEILEAEALRNSNPPPEPEASASHDEYETVAEPMAAEEPVYEEVPVVAPPPPVPAAPLAKKEQERVVEPEADHPAQPSPKAGRSFQAMPEEPAFASAKLLPPKQPPAAPKMEDEAPLPTPRAPQPVRLHDEKKSSPVAAVTPLVSFGGAAAGKKSSESGDSPLPRSADVSSDKPKTGMEAGADQHSKPFVAPKPAPEEPLDPDQIKKLRWKKLAEKVGLRTLGMSVGVHLFLLLTAAFIGVSHVMDRQVDFLPGGGTAQGQAASEALTHKIQNKKNPWLKERPQQRKITVQSLSANIVLPEMPAMDMVDFSKINNQMNISKAGSMGGPSQPMGMGGAGGGFGAGIGTGGKFSFVGQTAVGRRVVFVVDVSGSMSAIGTGETISRFALLKKELVKSMGQMPMGTAYQILFFSDFAWPHNEVDSRSADALVKYRWEIDPKDYKRVKIPTFKYIQANPFSLQDSKKIIEASDNPGGTNWGSGLLMALNANPKPDVIFFMTDGNRSDEMGWIDIVTAENKRKLPMTAIYTSAMQQPDAAPELDTLAKRNNGKFTVVMGEGKVIKGEDYFKMKK